MAPQVKPQVRRRAQAVRPQPAGFLNLPSMDELGRVRDDVIGTIYQYANQAQAQMAAHAPWIRTTAPSTATATVSRPQTTPGNGGRVELNRQGGVVSKPPASQPVDSKPARTALGDLKAGIEKANAKLYQHPFSHLNPANRGFAALELAEGATRAAGAKIGEGYHSLTKGRGLFGFGPNNAPLETKDFDGKRYYRWNGEGEWKLPPDSLKKPDGSWDSYRLNAYLEAERPPSTLRINQEMVGDPLADLLTLWSPGGKGKTATASLGKTATAVEMLAKERAIAAELEAARSAARRSVRAVPQAVPGGALPRGSQAGRAAQTSTDVASVGPPRVKGPGLRPILEAVRKVAAAPAPRVDVLGREVVDAVPEAAPFTRQAWMVGEGAPRPSGPVRFGDEIIDTGPPRIRQTDITSPLRKYADFPYTGVPSLDRLAIESPSFRRKLAAIERKGFNIQADTALLDSKAEFRPGIFAYNPETMTRLDWAHEWKHLQQIKQIIDRGIKLDGQAFRAMKGPGEIGAYSYEKALWERARLKPSQEYLDWHAARIRSYEDYYRSFRSLITKPWGRKWNGIKW